MHKFAVAITACLTMLASPVTASDEALEERVSKINELYEQAFSMPAEQRENARDTFLQIASVAESTLNEMEGLDDTSIRDLQRQAANGYYYAAEQEYWMAKVAENTVPLTSQMVSHLEKALALHSLVFADGANGMLVAEYYFGTSLLVEHGLETNDPRTTSWARSNIHAARLRIDESKMLDIDPPNGARVELIRALLDYAKATDDQSNTDEVMQLFDSIPEEDRGYSLRKRLRDEGLLTK